MKRTRNAVRNVIFGGLLKGYQILVPFIMRTLLIRYLGMEYLGLNSLFTSLLQILNLAELGVGSALGYSMYAPIAEGKKDVLFATAHNADDNLETLIFNLIRGSGAHGLSGIAPRRGYIVRPMLSLSSEEIRDFMRSRGESFVTDSTNADTSYTRNKIRTQVIPILRTVSPACERAAYSASLLIRRDDEYLFSEAQNIDSRFRYRRASRSRAFPRGDAHVFGGARRAHRSEIVTGRRMHATHPRRKALRSLASGGGLDVHIGRKYCLRSRRKKRNCTVL